MKNLTKLTLVMVPVITFSFSAIAHDPSMHEKTSEKADCSKMDHSKMDMNDPVAIAMMKKCMKQHQTAKQEMDEMDHSKMGEMDHSKMKSMDHSKMIKSEPKADKKAVHSQHSH